MNTTIYVSYKHKEGQYGFPFAYWINSDDAIKHAKEYLAYYDARNIGHAIDGIHIVPSEQGAFEAAITEIDNGWYVTRDEVKTITEHIDLVPEWVRLTANRISQTAQSSSL